MTQITKTTIGVRSRSSESFTALRWGNDSEVGMRKTVLPELVSRLPTMHRFRASIRMAIILATMSFGPMLAANMLGMLHIDNSTVLQERQMVCQKLATSVSNFLSTKDDVALARSGSHIRRAVSEIRAKKYVADAIAIHIA